MTIIEFSQAMLIYYAINALLALWLFDPKSKAFEAMMSGPAGRLRPEAVLITLLHVTLPLLVLAQVHPVIIRMRIRKLLIFVLRMNSKLLFYRALREMPPADRPAARAHFKAMEAQGAILLRRTPRPKPKPSDD